MSLVNLEHVSKVYRDQNKVPVRALTDISLSVNEGEFTAIAGPSGSGKTTMLNIIGGLDKPSSGEVSVAGEDLVQMDRNALAEFRLYTMGFVFQAYNLIPVLTAEENAEFMLLLQGVPAEQRRERVKQEFLALGIEEELMNRRPNELSGGQQQRVAVARALVSHPKLILADEPTANLDSKTGSSLLDKMKDMNAEKGVTFIFSTHDPMVMERARRLIRLRDGRIHADESRG